MHYSVAPDSVCGCKDLHNDRVQISAAQIVVTVLFLVFFFFQAEDGIRDLTVTGVQTCALPICSEVQLDEATRTLQLHHRDTRFDASSHRLPEEMRSSIMLVPPLLARFGVARDRKSVV